MARTVPAIFRIEPFADFEDPNAAPGAFRGPDGAPPWTLRRAGQNHLAMYLSGLIFMVFGIVSVVQTTTGLAPLVLGESVIALLSVLYVGAAWISDAGLAVRWVYVGLFGAVMVATSAFLGTQATSFGVYFAILLATLIPWRFGRVLIAVWGVVLIMIGAIEADWTPVLIGLIGLGVGYAVGSGVEQGRVSQKLRQAEVRASQLAVVTERERIARDLHDILGHSLTAVSIKSELAGRLIEIDPTAARSQIAEVEAIARQALADVRATASGMREVRLATEIASARSVLISAGIEASTPTALEPMGDEQSELLGYVVREAVTNVVRHSHADRCVITAGPEFVSITDDGRGLGRSSAQAPRSGSGLRGLRERVERAGGVLTLAAADGAEGAAGRGSGLRVRADLARSQSPPDRLAMTPTGEGPSARSGNRA